MDSAFYYQIYWICEYWVVDIYTYKTDKDMYLYIKYELHFSISTLLLVKLWIHLQGGHFSGIYRKVQLKPLKWVKVAKSNSEGEEEKPIEALMILKYGGVLTHAGRKQV